MPLEAAESHGEARKPSWTAGPTRVEAAGLNGRGEPVRIEMEVHGEIDPSLDLLLRLAEEAPKNLTWRAIPPKSPSKENRR